MQKGDCIIYKAERKLLNERIRNITNTIECYEHDRYMYGDQLKSILGPDMFKLYEEHINIVKAYRHLKVMEQQKMKFDRLCQRYQDSENCCPTQDHNSNNKHGHPNQDPKLTETAQRKYVINLSSTSLTPTQRMLSACGPHFAVAPWRPPYGDYITAIKLVCQNQNSTEAEELRADIYRVLRQPHHPKPNLSKDELNVLKQLRADKDHIILCHRQRCGTGGNG